MKKKILNWLLLISFIVTIMVPVTGIQIHKLASVLFLLLSVLHAIVWRKGLGRKKWGILMLVVISFITGLFGMILEDIPVVLQIHKVISIMSVFFLAIHIFVYHKRMAGRYKEIVNPEV